MAPKIIQFAPFLLLFQCLCPVSGVDEANSSQIAKIQMGMEVQKLVVMRAQMRGYITPEKAQWMLSAIEQIKNSAIELFTFMQNLSAEQRARAEAIDADQTINENEANRRMMQFLQTLPNELRINGAQIFQRAIEVSTLLCRFSTEAANIPDPERDESDKAVDIQRAANLCDHETPKLLKEAKLRRVVENKASELRESDRAFLASPLMQHMRNQLHQMQEANAMQPGLDASEMQDRFLG